MAPYRDVKGSLFRGGTISPAFVYHSSVANPGGFDDDYLTIMDLIPTFVDIGGGTINGTTFEGRPVLPVRGRSFKARIEGGTAPVHEEAVPILSGPSAAVVRWPWKIVGSTNGGANGEWMLFNLEDDPGERTDLAGQFPEIRDELSALVPGA
jgi:arylsulfatase